ncbi:YqjF family protein [Mycolicibacterium stellerae]|uniref:YqjF family protein n=1 Tax=Mycolicibacterium stellerae TaxID=2358193 RepID=UPI0038990402
MTSLTGYPVTAPPLARPVFFQQFWADLTFVHWPVRPEDVADLLPPGTRPDLFDGQTYAGLIPFTMRATAVGTALPVPYFGTFHETNVRLYSIDDAGRHGVVFRSLETARLAVVPVMRATLGVPYTWSRMRIDRSGDHIRYDSQRRWPRRGLRSELMVRIGEVVEPTPLEIWLTARWGAHTRKAGRTWWVPNEHGPWPLRSAEVIGVDDDLMAAAGIEVAGDRLRALFSPGVQARFGRPAKVK